MKTGEAVIQDRVNELLAVLDRDIEQLGESLSKLNELRTAVVKRNESSLGDLLANIKTESESYKNKTLQRQQLIRGLAGELGCNIEQITLSKLEGLLSGEEKEAVTERKEKLRLMTRNLKKEYMATARLLSECARFNRLLLKGIFSDNITNSVTYDSVGSSKFCPDVALVNLNL